MATARTPAPDRDERALAAVEVLLAERGIGRHATFWEVGEGEEFPDGTESMSGNVIDIQGRVYFFWTDWDVEHGRPFLSTWVEVAAEPAWSTSDEYLDACAAVGLS